MKKFKHIFIVCLQLSMTSLLISCGSHGGSDSATYNPYGGTYAANVLPVVVGDCGVNGYANEPCTVVKICSPGTKQCQTIQNILVDTGSYGLRIFSEKLNVTLKPVTDSNSNPIAECAQFGTSNTWGSIQTADVILSGEPSVNVSIQVIDSTFKSVPSACDSPDVSAAAAGYNGILGVGVLSQDCGVDCVSSSNPGFYYSCGSSGCASIKIELDKQVTNPVSQLPVDNNGVILELPAVPDGGQPSLIGTLTLGIGTASNNTPGSVKVFSADSAGDFTTEFQGHTYKSSFIDSGSNGLFFPETADLPLCSSDTSRSGFYCPSEEQAYSAKQEGADGVTQQDVSFHITNAEHMLFSYGPIVGAFNNLGGTEKAAFDWGLPFFFGRKVYVGLEGNSSSLATGTYWAW